MPDNGLTMPLYGIETEYGIAVAGKETAELLAEARALVRAYAGPFASPWNYDEEHPRRDMRGFEVDHLARDTADRRYDRGSAHYASTSDERSDRLLSNGARLYNDHGHPEYATPECRTLHDVVAHDRAGERIVWDCALRRAADGAAVTLFKNNTDFHGASYGCHESYLFPRDVPSEELREALLPFLVTRQVFAGAGKTGVEPGRPDPVFQVSQRADFFSEVASVDTLAKRPIFNTRDEPHADERRWRRLHVICGDANMSEYATALKVGSTAAVLGLLAQGWRPSLRLLDPVKSIRQISRDTERRWVVELAGRQTIRATDIQRIYASEAWSQLEAAPDDIRWAVREWLRTLDALESDWTSLGDRLDWVAKHNLLRAFMEEEGLDWNSPVLQSLDLAYHDLDPEAGLFRGLQEEGGVWSLVADEDITVAMTEPPPDTRAAARGALVSRFGGYVKAISWGAVTVEGSAGTTHVILEPWDAEAARKAAEGVLRAPTVEAAVGALTEQTHGGLAGQIEEENEHVRTV